MTDPLAAIFETLVMGTIAIALYLMSQGGPPMGPSAARVPFQYELPLTGSHSASNLYCTWGKTPCGRTTHVRAWADCQ